MTMRNRQLDPAGTERIRGNLDLGCSEGVRHGSGDVECAVPTVVYVAQVVPFNAPVCYDADAVYRTVLCYAAYFGHPELAALAVKHGADRNMDTSRMNQRDTALHLAARMDCKHLKVT